MKSLIELVKNGSIVVNAEHVVQVLAMAKRVGVCACGGALVERADGGFDKVLYTQQNVPSWVALVEELHNKWVEVQQEERAEFVRVCEALGVVVHGGAIVERGGKLMQGYYVE